MLPRSYHEVWSDLVDCESDLERITAKYLMMYSIEDPPQPQEVKVELTNLIKKLQAIELEKWEI